MKTHLRFFLLSLLNAVTVLKSRTNGSSPNQNKSVGNLVSTNISRSKMSNRPYIEVNEP